ncbi:hypothetical protein ERO13_D07G033550v2 [Gossypium hirsutum]|nr:hypothetical protein ERO13_D07G033550v2 [Gossypium hirsutum]
MAFNGLVAILVLGLVGQGFCVCSLNDIIVGRVRTGVEVQETVDPNIFQKQGNNCLVIDGNALNGFASVSFAYAWDPPFIMFPSGSMVDPC